jgi:alpha-tubulin suppressor-like RCC1 family protein
MEELYRWLAPANHQVVTAGWTHSFLHLENGEVYACGSNGSGQLGLGDLVLQTTWCLLVVPTAVREVVAGGTHSFLHLENGEVYGCGQNDDGQLGLGDLVSQDTWQHTH